MDIERYVKLIETAGPFWVRDSQKEHKALLEIVFAAGSLDIVLGLYEGPDVILSPGPFHKSEEAQWICALVPEGQRIIEAKIKEEACMDEARIICDVEEPLVCCLRVENEHSIRRPRGPLQKAARKLNFFDDSAGV